MVWRDICADTWLKPYRTPDNVSVSAFTLSKVSSFEMWVRTTHSTSHSLGRFSVGLQRVMYTSTKNPLIASPESPESPLSQVKTISDFCKSPRNLPEWRRRRFRAFLEGWWSQFWWYGCWTKNRGKTPKSSILIGFSIINNPFWGAPIFGITHILAGIFSHCLFFSSSSDLETATWL